MRVDKKKIEKEIEKILKNLKELGAEKVVLFGSAARGGQRVRSDIDLLAIFDDQDSFKSRMQKIYSEITSELEFDILAYNWHEFEKVKGRSFFRRIEKEGKVLYEADH